MSKLVRLKPHNPRKGIVMRSYTYGGTKFDVTQGWVEVDDTTAAYLARVHQSPENDESPLAFDVCTPEEAQELEDRQRAALETRATPKNPVRAARQRFREDRELAQASARGALPGAGIGGIGMPSGVVTTRDVSGEDDEGFDPELDNPDFPGDEDDKAAIRYARIAEVTPSIQEREAASNASLPHAPDLPGQPGTKTNAAKRRGGITTSNTGPAIMTHTGPAQASSTSRAGTPGAPIGASHTPDNAGGSENTEGEEGGNLASGTATHSRRKRGRAATGDDEG